MKVIWKYSLNIEGRQVIEMPTGAQIIAVQTQKGMPQIWAIVNPDNRKESRAFCIYGTGHVHDDIPGEYLGTFQFNDGLLVFRVFEEKTK